MMKRHPLVSYFALTYLITWTLHITALILAERAGVTIGNEENFRHFSDLLGLHESRDGVVAFLLFNLGQFGPAMSACLVTWGK